MSRVQVEVKVIVQGVHCHSVSCSVLGTETEIPSLTASSLTILSVSKLHYINQMHMIIQIVSFKF